MDDLAQVGAFAVGAARTEAVVKHVDVAGIWRILLLGVWLFGLAEGGELMMS